MFLGTCQDAQPNKVIKLVHICEFISLGLNGVCPLQISKLGKI